MSFVALGRERPHDLEQDDLQRPNVTQANLTSYISYDNRESSINWDMSTYAYYRILLYRNVSTSRLHFSV